MKLGMERHIREIINKRRRILGRTGEMLIVKHLVAKGYVLLNANYLVRCGEVDLVMSYMGRIHFIEVKTVSRENMIGNIRDFHVIHETNKYKPEQNVSSAKLKKILRTSIGNLMLRWYISIG
jgi:Holliday junction resolvase-like predicted endonuclease